ncbi:hypothetical protein [Sphingobacterium suaedae]|uniref:Right handed beta helix domain-containing protein n=1 Tax=Sphingobacterium suaedae TaxID=1686402 RepID=A0ABW5KM24_9SPHI
MFRLLVLICAVNCSTYLAYSQARYSYRDVSSVRSQYQQKDVRISNAVKIVDFLPKGYVKSGTVDYTPHVQRALEKGGHILFPNFPILINDNGIKVVSNSNIFFSKGGKLILKASAKGTYRFIKVHNANNVTITNAVLVGDRKTHIGKGGEWGIGIDIRNSKDITIERAIITDFWGDGVCIGAGIPNERVLIKDTFIDNCRRNGITIGSLIDSRLSNIVVSNTHGAAPMAGIDIEPNNDKDVINNIVIDNYRSYNNKSRGLLIDLRNFRGAKARRLNIAVSNYSDDGSLYGLSMPLLGKHANAVTGEVKLENLKFTNNKNAAVQPYDVSANSLSVKFVNHNVNAAQLKNVLNRIIDKK